MRWFKFLTAPLCVLFIMSCSGPTEQPPAKTVFDPLTQQEERAREVQKTVDQNAEATGKAIDTEERGDTPP